MELARGTALADCYISMLLQASYRMFPEETVCLMFASTEVSNGWIVWGWKVGQIPLLHTRRPSN